MRLFEVWSKKETNIWLHALKKDGSERADFWQSKRFYSTKEEAIRHHNHMVDANPGKVIAHNLHAVTGFGHFVMKLVGKYEGKKNEGK